MLMRRLMMNFGEKIMSEGVFKEQGKIVKPK